MFAHKIQMTILLIMLTVMLRVSNASTNVSELDTVGMMPEITVTAPRYEYQDEAWSGMVEGVVVEARRVSGSESDAAKVGPGPHIMFSGSNATGEIDDISMQLAGSAYLFLSFVLNLALVPLSLVYMSLSAYLAAKESRNE
jgi:hypothetical protein